MDNGEEGEAALTGSQDGAGNPSLLGRKSVLVGMLTSGLLLANVARPSDAMALDTISPGNADGPVYVPKWTPNMAYAVGQQVISPNNDVVSAAVAHTSSGDYGSDNLNWTLSYSYAAQFNAVAEVTTAAQITAWLAVPYAGIKRLTGTATNLSAPIVIPSNTYLDATGATLTMSTSAGCNMLNNTAVQPLRYGSGDAVVNGTTTVTTATGNFTAADIGCVLQVAFVNEMVRGTNVYGNIVSVNSSTSVVVDNACNFTETGGIARVYARDTNIHINGGTWNSCDGSGVQGNSLHFRRVDNLSITNAIVIGVAGSKYQIAPGDCTDVLVENIYGVAVGGGSNLVQGNGPGSNITVRGIAGSSYDDAVAFTTTDYGSYNDCHGSYSNLSVLNVAISNVAYRLVGFYTSTSGYVDGHSYDGIVVDNAKDLSGNSYGVCTAILCNDPNSRVDNLTISNTVCTIGLYHVLHGVVNITNHTGLIQVSISPGYPAVTNNAVENLHIQHHVGTLSLFDSHTVIGNLIYEDGSMTVFNFGTATIATAVIENTNLTVGLFYIASPCSIGTLTFRSVTSLQQPTVGANAISSGATVGDLNILDCYPSTTSNSWALVNVNSGGSLTNLRVARSYVNGLGDVLNNDSSSRPTLFLSDTMVVGGAGGRIVEGTGGATVLHSNVTFTGSQVPFYGNGPLTLQGSGFITSTANGFTQAGSGVVHVIDPNMHGDISVLAQALGDTAWNCLDSNGTTGPNISDGTVWRAVLTGAIKTGVNTLEAGTVTVSNVAITANSVIRVANKTAIGTPGAVFVSARDAGTSFTITSTSATDISVVQWDIITY